MQPGTNALQRPTPSEGAATRGGSITSASPTSSPSRRRDRLGYPGLKSHGLRKTCATLLDTAGLSARTIAEYLGHAKPSMTQDVYMSRNVGSADAAARIMSVSEFLRGCP
jgi:integrase